MEIIIINEKVLDNLLSETEEIENEDILACDGGCSCDTDSKYVVTICPREWYAGWAKATC